eukprot:CAMPEP_0203880856 /NCGR_PEP_ID=MMETSP0359-20131031/25240_1 /ASSEMBLY_ACC=CAM_ASM_000338 /TAXON_ID=268821 /ORGANISM="Scrippsiella Hangoei, Strain SHTV-5" /LENGTH=108 /DNA_ID=CAMNT_0050800571 /DNA_START=515 /DNA_END=841 /DNA_ORIENTATION=-
MYPLLSCPTAEDVRVEGTTVGQVEVELVRIRVDVLQVPHPVGMVKEDLPEAGAEAADPTRQSQQCIDDPRQDPKFQSERQMQKHEIVRLCMTREKAMGAILPLGDQCR